MSIIDLNQFSSIISIANGNQLIMISDTFELSIGNIESLTYCNYYFFFPKRDLLFNCGFFPKRVENTRNLDQKCFVNSL